MVKNSCWSFAFAQTSLAYVGQKNKYLYLTIVKKLIRDQNNWLANIKRILKGKKERLFSI